jgi:polyisoprenoid-binding protein YceI
MKLNVSFSFKIKSLLNILAICLFQQNQNQYQKMKKTLLLLSLLPLSVGISSWKHVDLYKVDTAKSSIEWYAEKVTGKHNGTISLKSGELANNHGRFGGSFVMDMTSLVCTDLKDGSKAKLEGHLKSDDFFSVQKHPTASFEITSMSPISGAKAGAPNYTVAGKMTIKGITNDISFPANVTIAGTTMMATADIKIDRSKYDIRYGSKSFFSDIGDKAIFDDFTLKVKLVGSL